jgi:chemotaxis signal transduction protein
MSSDSTATTPDEGGDRFLVVELRGGLYGIDGTLVREIVGVLGATRLPGAPPHVQGVVNLRGQLLTVVDLGHRLTGAPTDAPEGSIVVIAASEKMLGLVVDDVHDVQELHVVPTEREVLAKADGLLTGVGRLGDEIVLVIDIPELVRQVLA